MATNLDMLESYTSPVRTVGAKIALTDGTNTTTLTEQDKMKSAKIERTGDNTKFFGYGVSQKLNVKALDIDKEINLTTSYSGKLQMKVNNSEYIDASPDFTVSEVHRDEVSGELSITGYDALHEASKYTFADLGLVAPYTMRDVAEAIGGKIGASGVDSNHFSPNLAKPLEQMRLAYNATLEGEYITLPDTISQAYITIPWGYREDDLYIKFTSNSIEADVAYNPYVAIRLYDKDGKEMAAWGYWDKNIVGEHTYQWNSTKLALSNREKLKKAYSIRIVVARHATNSTVPFKFKNLIVSTKDIPYTPYGSDRAIRNLAKPIEEWALYQGATRSDGWITLPTTPAYSHYYIPWNGSTDTFYIKATVNSDAETFPYYVGYQFISAAGSILYSTVATYGTTSGETIISWNSSGLSAANKEKLKQTAKVRVFFTGRAIDGVAVPYKFKDVRFSLTDGEYVPYEGEPFALTYETGANYEGTETLQEVLNDIAEATQTIYFINNSGTLYFKKLDIDGEPVATINKEKYISLDSSTNRRLSEIVSATELGDNLAAALTVSGSKQFIRDNPFWDLREDRAQLVNNALSAVQGLTINQFNCSWRGFPFLEIGDKIALTTKDDNTVISYFLSDALDYNGALSQSTEWKYENNDAETASNPTTLGEAIKQTYAKVDKTNKRIELVAKENEDKYASLVITTEGIDSAVKNVEKKADEIDEELGTVKSTVSTNTTNIAQNAEQIALKASSEEVSTIKTEIDGTLEAHGISLQTVEKSVSDLSVSAEGISASVQNLTTIIETNAEGVANEIAEINKKVDMNVSAEDVSIAIQTEMAKGTDRVITSTGYKFDEEGLTVSKSNSEMETKITEDGMVVYKNGDAVLTANNQGVDAKNLHATTYLIVGTNSRFEDYGNRTGCFWVGGAD